MADRLSDVTARLVERVTRLDKTPASTPLGAVQLAHELNQLSGDALRLAVERARSAGHTWQEVGDLLGVSRQAAFQRFARPLDPRTVAPMSIVIADAGVRAVQVLLDMMEGRYVDVIAQFDTRMTDEMPAEKFAAAAAQLLATVGTYEHRMGEPFVRQLGDYTVADVPMSFEASEMKGRVAFDRDGRISGLFVLPESMP